MEKIYDLVRHFIDTFYLMVDDHKKFNIGGFWALAKVEAYLGFKREENFLAQFEKITSNDLKYICSQVFHEKSLFLYIIHDNVEDNELINIINKVKKCGYTISDFKKPYVSGLNHKFLAETFSPIAIIIKNIDDYRKSVFNLNMAGIVYNPIDNVIHHLWITDTEQINQMHDDIRKKKGKIIFNKDINVHSFIEYWELIYQIDIDFY